MTLFCIAIPSPRLPGMSTIDSAWSLKEEPGALDLAATRLQELRREGIRARIAQHGGSLIVRVPTSRMAH